MPPVFVLASMTCSIVSLYCQSLTMPPVLVLAPMTCSIRTDDLFYSFATPQHVLSYSSMGLSKAKNPAKVTVLPCTIIKHHLLAHSATMVKHPKQSCVYDIIHHHVVRVRQHQDLWPSMHLIPRSHIPTKHEVLDT